MSSSPETTKAKPRTKADAQEQDDTLRESEIDARWRDISKKVREYVQISFHEMGAASWRQTQELLDGLRHKPKNEKELEGWESFVYDKLDDQLQSARKLYYEKLMDPLLSQLDKTISKRVLEEMDKKFKDSSVDYKDKESYIQRVLPARIHQWKKVKERRDTLVKHPNMKKISSKQVKNLSAFLDEKRFIDLKYPERKGLTDLIESIILSQESKLEYMHKEIQKELEDYVADGRLHRSKIGTWMKRIFTKNATEEDVEAFIESTVRPFAENWKEARHRLNDVNQQMNVQGIPRGLQRLSLSQFLFLEYDQRIAYLDEAESRLNGDVNEDTDLARLTLDVRHALDTKDWETAQTLLAKAQKIDPEDKRVKSMARYLLTHGPKPENNNELMNGIKALHAVRDIMSRLPSNMRWMTERALNHPNPNVLKRLWQGFYNRHWVIAHRYSTEAEDRKQGESDWNKEQTADRIANGHDWTHERNIIKGDTANDQGIRDDCLKPQQIYTDSSGKDQVYKAFERNADNSLFGYWTTIVDNDVPYGKLREHVLNDMYPLKKYAGIMRAAGIEYSSFGNASSLKEAPVSSTIPASFALAA